MYGLYGFQENLKNIYKLAAPFASAATITTTENLRPHFLNFLQSAHKTMPITGDHPLFDRSPGRLQKLLSSFVDSKLNDLDQENMVGALHTNEIFELNLINSERSLADLKTRAPELGHLFDLAVHSIALCGSQKNQEGHQAQGGTSNECIGLIWLNLKPQTTDHDIIEMLIHEFTHTLVFIDELNHGHFNYEILTKMEFWATSAILNRCRPMDKVVHSIIVSTEILLARHEFLPANDDLRLHPKSELLRAQTLDAIASVLNHPGLSKVCMPRAIQLVKDAKTRLLELN